MKKTTYLNFILLFFCVCNNITAQEKNFVFFYDLEYAIDSTDLLNKKNELMVLWNTPSQSLFQSYNGYQRDSVTNYYLDIAKENDKVGMKTGSSNINQMMQDLGRFPHAGFTYKILKSKEEGVIYNYRNILRSEYVYSEPLQNLKWQIREGVREVMDYTCQIASTEYGGRKFVAWFTADIPINDGPYIFNGLPGLIMELYDADCHYHFKLVGIEKREVKIAEQLPDNVIKLDKARYFKLEDDYRRNPLGQMSEADAMRVSPSVGASYQERVKSKNNRLELVIEK